MVTEPLAYFHRHFGFDTGRIHRIEAGRRYVGLMLTNGQIGVCSTLNNPLRSGDVHFAKPDLSRREHRIVYNAYLNALLNYEIEYESENDIFEHIDFARRGEIVMIGYFRPLVKKFRAAGIHLTIFDQLEKDGLLTPLEQMSFFLSTARSVILSSTTLSNNTFLSILEQTPTRCEIFLLGPSSLLHPWLKRYKNIVNIYGTLFNPFDDQVLDVISAGKGTRTFLKYGKKVHI
jgi:uncharacterized protein (DUF4213/DUF364 family)